MSKGSSCITLSRRSTAETSAPGSNGLSIKRLGGYRISKQTISKCIALYRACGRALDRGLHKTITLSRIDPVLCGARKSLGSPRKGKKGDYEIPLPPCMRCHIVEYEDRLEVHVDSISPLCDPITHLVLDATRDFALATTSIAMALLGVMGSLFSASLLASLAAYTLARLP